MGGKGSGGAHSTPASTAARRRTAGRKPAGEQGRRVAFEAAELDLERDDPAVEKRLKRLAIPSPESWQEAKIAEQTRAEIYRTIAAQVALAEARKTLVPSSVVADRCAAVRDVLVSAMREIPDMLVASLGDHLTPAQISLVAEHAENAVVEKLGKVAANAAAAANA